MSAKSLYQKPVIIAILFLQLIPLVMFPADSFSPKSQEWWLPMVLAVLVLVAIIQLVIRKSTTSWPWYLVGFSQGFNVISRLMMLMPHASSGPKGAQVYNIPYITLSVASILLSWAILWYIEKPEVRMNLLRN